MKFGGPWKVLEFQYQKIVGTLYFCYACPFNKQTRSLSIAKRWQCIYLSSVTKACQSTSRRPRYSLLHLNATRDNKAVDTLHERRQSHTTRTVQETRKKPVENVATSCYDHIKRLQHITASTRWDLRVTYGFHWTYQVDSWTDYNHVQLSFSSTDTDQHRHLLRGVNHTGISVAKQRHRICTYH